MIAEKLYEKVHTLEQAVALAQKHANSFKYMAGGTDLMVNRFQGNDESNCLIDLSGINELKEIKIEDSVLKIGSLVTLDDLKKNQFLAEKFPSLIQAAHEVASPILRKAATLGGNILCENRCSFFNQSEFWREAVGYCLKCEGNVCIATGGTKACFSKFVSDTAPVLISLNASLEVLEDYEVEQIALESIYTGDGIHPRNLSPMAIIKYIVLPLDTNYQVVFKKLRPREAVDFTSLTTAVSMDQNGKIKIAVGGIDPKPIVVEGNSMDEKDTLIKQVVKKARIVENDYYSRAYRKEMLGLFLRESLEEIGK